MTRQLKKLVRTVLPPSVFAWLKRAQRSVCFYSAKPHADEEPLTLSLLHRLGAPDRYCVDIAAQDGVLGSQTLRLYQQGWRGLALEVDSDMFSELARLYRALPDVMLLKARVRPDNVAAILTAVDCPASFGFLSLDIDSFDYFVLEAILKSFRPRLICVEVNETIPPPLRFTVNYPTSHAWSGDHFQGQSLSQAYALGKQHKYDLIALHYNNAFFAASEINTLPALAPAEAYQTGYVNRSDRKIKFPWNADMEPVLHLPPHEAAGFVREKFSKYDGRYTLEV